MGLQNLYRLANIDTPFDPTSRFFTSYYLPPLALGGLRLIFSIYGFTTLIVRMALIPEDAAGSFSYFTVITYWTFAFYNLISAFHTFQYYRTGATPLQTWPRSLQFLHSLLYTTLINFPFLVTSVYWTLLFPDGGFKTVYAEWNNVSVHGLNSMFALSEIINTRTNPPPLIFIPFLMLFLGCYLGVAYITFLTQGFFTYAFLDPRKAGSGRVLMYIAGILVGANVLFFIIWGIVWCRKALFERLLGKTEDRYAAPSTRANRIRGGNNDEEKTRFELLPSNRR